MRKTLIIPEGAKIRFSVNHDGELGQTFEANTNMEVAGDTLVMVDGGLYCTDTCVPVEKEKENEYILNLWYQDAMTTQDGVFYSSSSELV